MIIAIEGVSGSGKTTLINNLIAKFEDKRIIPVHHPKKGSLAGASAINLIKEGKHLEGGLLALQDIKESYNTARINKESIYLWSRCQLSTVVYNGRNMDDQKILLSAIQKDKCYPDYLFYLDIPAYVCWKHTALRNRSKDLSYSVESLQTDINYYRQNKSFFAPKIGNYYEGGYKLISSLLNFVINNHG